MEEVSPITFPTFDSHLRLDRPSASQLRVSFSFRSYSDGGLIFSNALNMDGKILVRIHEEFDHKTR